MTLYTCANRALSTMAWEDEDNESTKKNSKRKHNFLIYIISGFLYLAWFLFLVYGFLEFIKRQIFASTADSEHLDVIGSEVGVVRKSAAKSSGYALATGTDDTVIPANTELINGRGLNFESQR